MLYLQKFGEEIVWGNKISNYVWFLGFILIGLPFLRFFSKIFSRLIFKFFHRFSDEVKGEKFVELLLKPVQLLFLVSILYIAINHLDYPLNEVLFKRKKIEVTFLDAIDKLFLFFIIISITWIFLRIVDFIALVFAYRASLTESKADDQLVLFVKELVKIITGVIGLFVLLGMVFEINVLTLITGLGIGGIAIALAAKESLENLLGSFTIFFDRPFVVGDLVRIEGLEGTVEKVGFRSTQLRTVDKSVISVPNKKMIEGALENMTLRNYRRIKFSISLTYNTPPEKIKKIIEEINFLIRNTPKTSEDGIAIFETFGEYSLGIMVLYFIEMMEYNDYLQIREEINFKIAEIVHHNDASFALPTRTVIHLDGSSSIQLSEED